MVHLQLRAVIQCDREWTDEFGSERGCVATDYYVADATAQSLDQFANDADQYFFERGWVRLGGTSCPGCVRQQSPAKA